MVTRLTGLVAGFLLIICLAIEPAQACSCRSSQSLEEDYRSSNAVFVGKVIGIQAKHGQIFRILHALFHPDDIDNELFDLIIEFEVTESFKGLGKEKQVRVVTSDPAVCCICGYEFVVNREYLVFATGTELGTSICHRTKTIAEATMEVKQLRALLKTE